MKHIQKGYTLAEILIALSIVGVIATILTPTLAKNIQKQTSGAALGRAVTQIELGCQNIIQLANSERTDASFADTLSMVTQQDIGYSNSTNSILLDFANIIPPYWGLNADPIDPNTIKTIRSYGGGANANDNTHVQSSTLYTFNKTEGDVAIYEEQTPVDSSTLNAYTGYIIYIDTNGWKTLPNVAGKDVFAFKLLNNGKLIPADGLSANGTDAGEYAMRAMENGFKLNY